MMTPKPATAHRCRPSQLKIFLFALSFAYITKTLALTYSRSMITQIERRFNIPSKLVGVIDSSFDIGNLLVITIVSYYGARFHRPRMIAAGCLIMFLGASLAALPHFLMNRYQYGRAAVYTSDNTTSNEQLCLSNQSHTPEEPEFPEDCDGGSSESLMWVFVLVGNILQGIGESPVEPLGVSYVDDFAKVENSPFYIGIIQTLSIVGPLLGSLLASYFAEIFVDVGFVNLDEVFLRMTDTRWVGAWWLGFLVSGALNLLAAVPFCFIPKTLPKEGDEGLTELREALQLPGTDNNMDTAERTTAKPEEEDGVTDLGKRLQASVTDNNLDTANTKTTKQGFHHFMKKLLRNEVYMLFLLVTVIQFSAFVGFMSFTPKFLEQQYGISASEAIFLMAVYSLPVIAVGYFLGGYCMKRYKISTFMAAKLGFFTSITEYLLYILAFALVCKNATVAGLTVTYDGLERVSYLENLTSDCNANCGCERDVWDPVCGDNAIGYASACLAGCSYSTGRGQDQVFHNCSCIPSANASAVLGPCAREERCHTMLLYFMILNMVCCFIFSLGAMPGYMVLIRSLTPEEKSFGLGLQLLAARALGGIPSPIYYGAAIDTTCIKWGSTSCGERGACRMYDSDAYRYLYIGLPTVLRFVSYIPCVFILLALRRAARANTGGSPQPRTPRGDEDRTDRTITLQETGGGYPQRHVPSDY